MVRNNCLLTLLLSAFFLFVPTERVYASAADPEVDQTDAPMEIRKTLKEHAQEMQALMARFSEEPNAVNGTNTHIFPWLPDYYVKYGVSRYLNAKNLDEMLALNGMSNDVEVAKKFLWHIPDKPYSVADDHYVVIAKKVTGTKPGEVPLIHPRIDAIFKSVQKIIHRGFHIDMHENNYLITPEKAVIIDTDDEAMPREPKRSQITQWLDQQRPFPTRYLQKRIDIEKFSTAYDTFLHQKEEIAKIDGSMNQNQEIAMLKGAMKQHEQEIFSIKGFFAKKWQKKTESQQKKQEDARQEQEKTVALEGSLNKQQAEIAMLQNSMGKQKKEIFGLKNSLKKQKQETFTLKVSSAKHKREISSLQATIAEQKISLQKTIAQQEEDRRLRSYLVGAFVAGGVVGASVVAWSKYKPAQKGLDLSRPSL